MRDAATPPRCCMPTSGGTGAVRRVALAPARRSDPGREGMVLLPGGEFLMGAEDAEGFANDGEGPVRRVRLAPFRIDACAVTNEQFGAFVGATGHRTDAERLGWSYVFAGFLPAALRRDAPRPERTPWWCGVEGAAWDSSEGPGSTRDGRETHPVVQCVPERRGSVRELGGKAAADRGGVGVRRTRRPGAEALSVGRRARPGRRLPLQHLAGAVPGEEHGRGRLPRHRSRRRLRTQWLRPVRQEGCRSVVERSHARGRRPVSCPKRMLVSMKPARVRSCTASRSEASACLGDRRCPLSRCTGSFVQSSSGKSSPMCWPRRESPGPCRPGNRPMEPAAPEEFKGVAP